MADGEMPPGPAGMPPPGAAGQPGSPTGSTPAAMPAQNRGNQAAGLPKGAIAIKIAEAARLAMQPGSPEWSDFGKAIELMGKHSRPDQVSSGLMSTELQRLQQQQRQNSANVQMMRGMQGGGQPAPQPPGTPAG